MKIVCALVVMVSLLSSCSFPIRDVAFYKQVGYRPGSELRTKRVMWYFEDVKLPDIGRRTPTEWDRGETVHLEPHAQMVIEKVKFVWNPAVNNEIQVWARVEENGDLLRIDPLLRDVDNPSEKFMGVRGVYYIPHMNGRVFEVVTY